MPISRAFTSPAVVSPDNTAPIAILPRCYIERRRYDGGRWHGDGDGLEVFLERLRRMTRAGWAVTVLQETATGDLVALGVLEPDAELEPDRRGQFELPLD